MISKKLVFGLVLLVAVGLAIGTYSVRTNHKNNNQSTKKVEASSSSAVLTSQAEWEAGSLDNIDSTMSPGTLSISNISLGQKIDLSSGTISVTQNQNMAGNVIDGNWSTFWEAAISNPPANQDWQIDMGSQISFNKIKASISGIFYGGEAGGFMFVYGSNNGTDWTLLHQFNGHGPGISEYTFPATQNYRYIRNIPNLSGCDPANCTMKLFEFEVYSNITTATHTTGTTQLNGGADFFEWQTFTPTYTKPANTNVQFRFRSSTNSTDWTSWTDYQTPSSGSPLDITSLVTSRTGPTDSPTFYKYLQVEAKLTTTDGTSTPTLSDYSIGYHTNRPPDTPVAGTVIIGN